MVGWDVASSGARRLAELHTQQPCGTVAVPVVQHIWLVVNLAPAGQRFWALELT